MEYSEKHFASRDPRGEASFHHRLIRAIAPFILKVHGRAIIVVPNCGSCWQRWLGDSQWGYGDPTHLHFFTRKSFRTVVGSLFSDCRFFTYPVPALWMVSPFLARHLAFGLGTHLIAGAEKQKSDGQT